ncbi:sodium potassium chloride cotransporter [Arctopsyche grandis]|uniref:sodium potassium chloride cotransporter n=1 Tax=Arctopsyche grandis TaxID=121162 RepID=UPI00406D75A0
MDGRFNICKVNNGFELNEDKGSNGNLEAGTITSSLDVEYVGNRKRSLAQLTREALPRLDNYRISKRALKRPSLGELHGEIHEKDEIGDLDQKLAAAGHEHVGIKLGWIQGVLIPCLLNIWGVMLFLRLSWVVAQSGIGQSLIIIGISAIVCVITTLSLSAICTNGEVKGGGIYYIISRSLGPEFGASVGIVFAFANAVAASMNTIGFCNSLNDLLSQYDVKIIDGGNNDVRIIGCVALVIMIFICAVGMEWETKAQNFLVAIIVGAIIDFLIGTSVGPLDDDQKAKGFPGFELDVFKKNWGPDYRYSENVNQDFFSVFAIFFPSVTGIQAGANISGDLKDPAGSIPKGTLLSLLLSMFSYALFVVFAGGAALRDASGNVTDLFNGTLADCVPHCKYGLHNSYSVMQLMSSWGPFIYAGCFAATLSTALTNLLSVPRLIQALGIDRIYPGLIFFSKGYGKSGEPYRGYVLTFVVAAVFLLIAELNLIAPLISNFYLASYALINFCTFHAALIKPVGWRPTFRFYNLWLSLFGFIMCVTIMFLIDWTTSLVTFIIIFALYLIVVYRKPDVNWGSSTQAQTYKNALTSTHKMTNISEHVKNYRPQILVLSGKPHSRPPLVDLANLITKHNSLLLCADISPIKISYRKKAMNYKVGYEWLRDRKVKSFFTIVDGFGLECGAKALFQAAGIGKLTPNVLMMGYKQDWRTCPWEDLNAYFNVLHNAFDNRMAVVILRLSGGLDFSKLLGEDEVSTPAGMLTSGASTGDLTISHRVTPHSGQMMHADSNLDIMHMAQSESPSPYSSTLPNPPPTKHIMLNELKPKKKALQKQIIYQARNGAQLSKEALNKMSLFQNNQGKGTIDVWWLYDDGGLAILLPYIISTRHNWAGCKLRIFALTNRRNEMELEERNMANLLSKFRIDYSSLTMVQDITEKPKPATVQMFDGIINGFRESEVSRPDCKITDTELATLEEKTNRQLRLRELLLENSMESSLIVMSLPMPRKGTVSAPLYMAWLEVMTRDMPPFLLVRGNQSSVLTFYS